MRRTLLLPPTVVSSNSPFFSLSSGLTPCESQIGFVIYDVVCLVLGFKSIRKAQTAPVADAMAAAAFPVLSKLE
jgi:hypothetical protein